MRLIYSSTALGSQQGTGIPTILGKLCSSPIDIAGTSREMLPIGRSCRGGVGLTLDLDAVGLQIESYLPTCASGTLVPHDIIYDIMSS